jgi:hypothetical protein
MHTDAPTRARTRRHTHTRARARTHAPCLGQLPPIRNSVANPLGKRLDAAGAHDQVHRFVCLCLFLWGAGRLFVCRFGYFLVGSFARLGGCVFLLFGCLVVFTGKSIVCLVVCFLEREFAGVCVCIFVGACCLFTGFARVFPRSFVGWFRPLFGCLFLLVWLRERWLFGCLCVCLLGGCFVSLFVCMLARLTCPRVCSPSPLVGCL